MRIRILRIPPIREVDGITLHWLAVGRDYKVGNALGAQFLAEGWAEPVPLDAPKQPALFGADDPFGVAIIDRNSPPNLIREHEPPYVGRDIAADSFRWRRRPRP
jgi:hypothetical protein